MYKQRNENNATVNTLVFLLPNEAHFLTARQSILARIKGVPKRPH